METVINILILETEPSDTVAVLDELHRPDLKIGTLEIKRPADVLPKLEMNPPGGDPRLHPGAGPRVVRTAGTSARVQPDAPGHRHHRAMRAGPACGAHGMWRRRACAPAKPRRTRRRDPLHAGEPLPSPSMPEIEVVRELDPVESRSRAARGTCEPPVVRCICEGCSRIADASGEWERFNVFLRRNQKTIITLGLCPECARDRADFSEPARPWLQPH